MRTIQVSEFKAKCLDVLDEVERTGEPVTIIKRGRPVARLVPPAVEKGRYPQDALFGTVEFLGDVVESLFQADVSPVFPSAEGA